DEHQARAVVPVELGPRGRERLAQFVPRGFQWQLVKPVGQLGGCDCGKCDDLNPPVPVWTRLYWPMLFQDRMEVPAAEAERSPPARVGPRLTWPMLSQDRMEVAAAEAERAQPGPPRTVGPRQPRTLIRVHIERGFARFERLDRLHHLERRRQHLVVKGECHLD